MGEFRVAVKAFIIKENKILLIKRRSNDVHKPNAWDIPGGRLALGENPFEGLKRETKEEIGLDIEIIIPVDVHHFIREDEQKITMIIFLCKPLTENIQLSEEHQEYKWIEINSEKREFPEWLYGVVNKVKRYIKLN
ncbi:NUDIX domain-containing protein [Candidatus Woesearchaeota archaeon]|nr:NUDIX domain-containing protein [Candidatus Woesearchaeota archaeon]